MTFAMSGGGVLQLDNAQNFVGKVAGIKWPRYSLKRCNFSLICAGKIPVRWHRESGCKPLNWRSIYAGKSPRSGKNDEIP